MTAYQNKSFTISPGMSDAYRENFDKVFKNVHGAEAELPPKPQASRDLHIVVPISILDTLIDASECGLDAMVHREPVLAAIDRVRALIRDALEGVK